MKTIRSAFWMLWMVAALPLKAADSGIQSPDAGSPALILSGRKTSTPGIWPNGAGGGFGSTTESISLESGASDGVIILGGRIRHNLALASLSYGQMLSSVAGAGHWYRGNWELRGELFAGSEFSPGSTWVVGLTPHLRYDFATGTRWVPFADIGAGVTATGERASDLGGTFEFNLQAAGGIHWFVWNHTAITAEVRFLHVSSAGLYHPNLGLNTVAGLVGITWFF